MGAVEAHQRFSLQFLPGLLKPTYHEHHGQRASDIGLLPVLTEEL